MTFSDLQKELKGDLFTDDLQRILYATDASSYREMPLAVTRPKDKENIKKLIRFAGSEGTLAFTARMKLNLVPLPSRETGLICAHFTSLQDALKANILILKHNPASIEMIDDFICREFDNGRIASGQFTSDHKSIKLHGHCQQKAISSTGFTKRMLSIPVNYKVEEIPGGSAVAWQGHSGMKKSILS